MSSRVFNKRAARFLAFIAGLCLAVCLPALAQDCAEVQDTAAAINRPDRYAWELFVALNQPADPATNCRDSSKPFGADGPVVWETWRNVRPSAPDTVFPPNGADPGPWSVAAPPAMRRLSAQENRSLKQFTRAAESVRNRGAGLTISFDPVVGEFNEVRMNRAAYDFVREVFPRVVRP